MIILVFAPADSRVFFVKYWNLFNPSFIILFVKGEADQVKWYKRYMKMYRTFYCQAQVLIPNPEVKVKALSLNQKS